jgi:uroporphyrinogen decarboxylase
MNPNDNPVPANARQRILALLEGRSCPETPWALWKHFPGTEYRPDEFVEAHIRFFNEHPFDLIKIGPRSSWQIRDYGTDDYYDGDVLGRPCYPAPVIRDHNQWAELKPLHENSEFVKQTVACAARIAQGLRGGRPILMTVFSPYSLARHLRGADGIASDLLHHPDALRRGLEVLADNTRMVIDQLRSCHLDGIFYAIQDTASPAWTGSALRRWLLDLDASLLAYTSMPLNMMHLHGDIADFDDYLNFPVSILHFDEIAARLPLEAVAAKFKGIVSGGIPWVPPQNGRVAKHELAQSAKDACKRMHSLPFLLSASCVIPHDATPEEIKATRPPSFGGLT